MVVVVYLLLLIVLLFYNNTDLMGVNATHLSVLPLLSKNSSVIYNQVLKFKSWPKIMRYKKDKAVAHCKNVPVNLTAFRKNWLGVSGIYKITFLPFRLFTYYCSSSNLGEWFKYHFYNGHKKEKFLGIFLWIFGWSKFSITILVA